MSRAVGSSAREKRRYVVRERGTPCLGAGCRLIWGSELEGGRGRCRWILQRGTLWHSPSREGKGRAACKILTGRFAHAVSTGAERERRRHADTCICCAACCQARDCICPLRSSLDNSEGREPAISHPSKLETRIRNNIHLQALPKCNSRCNGEVTIAQPSKFWVP